MIKVGLLGSHGRMGKCVSQVLDTEFSKKAQLAAQVDRGDASALLSCDVVIDFSAPAGMTALAQAALARGGTLPAFVVGSTGWKLDERRVLQQLGETTAVIQASNFSLGVLALQEVLRHSSPLLEKLGYTPVIVETHHKHKKDSPSGTALSIQRMISPAGPGNIQVHSVRAGEVIGDHEVTFHGKGETISIGHFAQDRAIFARGAVEVALWVAKKKASKPDFKGLMGAESFFDELLGKTS